MMMQNQRKDALAFSHNFMMRNELPESEPLSEYTEYPMTPQQTMPLRLRHTTPQASTVYQGGRPSHVPSPYTRRHPAPYKQNLAPQFDLEPKFVAQSLPSASPAKPRAPASKPNTPPFSSMQKIKTNIGTAKSTTQVGKFNLMDTRFFTGSTEQVVRWHKMVKQAHAIYEVSGLLKNKYFKPSGVYTMILIDENSKNSALQVEFYTIDRELPKVNIGQLIICVGRMVGAKKLQAYDLWPAAPDSLIGLQRSSFLCQRTLQETATAQNP